MASYAACIGIGRSHLPSLRSAGQKRRKPRSFCRRHGAFFVMWFQLQSDVGYPRITLVWGTASQPGTHPRINHVFVRNVSITSPPEKHRQGYSMRSHTHTYSMSDSQAFGALLRDSRDRGTFVQPKVKTTRPFVLGSKGFLKDSLSVSLFPLPLCRSPPTGDPRAENAVGSFTRIRQLGLPGTTINMEPEL